jgi:hypothetical protein
LTVRLPPGLAFDPGGVGKGLAADLVTQHLIERGATRAMVNVGGDLRIRSIDLNATPWAISIDEPACPAAPSTVVQLIDGAVATSTTQKRRRSTRDGDRHHVLDPATGLPRVNGPALASVIAADAWWAEVAATAALDPLCPPLAGAVTRRVFDDGRVEQDVDFASYEPKWLLSLHRFLGTLSVVFTGVPIAGLVAANFVHFGWAETLVPFASGSQPRAVAWGIVSMYLLVAVQASSMLMHRMPRRWWKRIHLLSYLMFWTGLVHGVQAGTDADNALYIGGTATLGVLVVFLTTFRILTARKRTPHRSDAAPTLTNVG